MAHPSDLPPQQAAPGRPRRTIDRVLGLDPAAEPSGVTYWQEQLFRIIFLGAAVLGLGGYLLNAHIAYQAGHWPRVAAYTVIYAAILVIALTRRLPYRIRAWTGLAVFYLMGIFSFAIFGPASSGRMWLLSFALLASLLFGLRAGLKAMALNVLTFIVLTGLMFSGRLDALLQPLNAASVWVTSGVTFLYLSTVAAFGLGFFVDRLKGSERWQKAMAEWLEAQVSERTEALKTANRQLRHEVDERRLAEDRIMSAQERLRLLYRRLQQAREEERRRISREVHDELGQNLTALRIDLAWLKRKWPGGGEPIEGKLESMGRVVDATLQGVRRISTELRPGVLDALGLCPAVEWLLKDFEKRTETRCEAVIEPEDIKVDQGRRTAVFRILQEALTNIARHARATQVKVTLRQEDGCLRLKIVDNGVGISEEKANSPAAIGISGIRERVDEYGGELRIQGRAGVGSEIAVSIPIE